MFLGVLVSFIYLLVCRACAGKYARDLYIHTNNGPTGDALLSRYATYLARLNRRLGQIMPGLTSYYARHTWATLAFDLDISDHVIAMGISHETGKANTNHFYINNDYRKLDRANRMVIDYVEGKIELD